VTILEARAEQSGDPRPIALSHGSRMILERMGAWRALADAEAPTAIDNIHVSQRGGFGRVAISAADAQVPALGYVVNYHAVAAALADAVREAKIDYREGARVTALRSGGESRQIEYTYEGEAATLSASLAVVADGGEIPGVVPPKVIDYAQHALTAHVRSTRPHAHVAYERFTPDGPLALLPFGEAMALVWTLAPARAKELMHADEKIFLAALHEAFGARLGEFTAVSQLACYPLALRYSVAGSGAGIIAIGNAAQTLHPVAGQGFNLGLRDAYELARRLRTVPVQTLAHPETARAYNAARRIERTAMIAATHGMVRLFSNDFFPVRATRGLAMTVLGCVAPARNFFARRMIFGARG
jgi:2-octaprenyl-6-methoxyphenol hydroxylase